MILDQDTRDILRAMPTWRDELIPYARDQARDLGIPVELWRRTVNRLIAEGLATYGPVFREFDGIPVGSSYWLTERGVAQRDQLEIEEGA